MSLPTFPEVLERYALPADGVPPVEQTALDDPRPGPMARLVLDYLSGLGRQPITLAVLLQAINGLKDEEELSAIRCTEGVAVNCASEGWWVLFREARHG